MMGPSFSEMREQYIFTDAVIKSASGMEWNVHRVVMSRLGRFMCKAFLYKSLNGTLEMPVSDEVCQCIVDLAYKDECDINHDNALETLAAALMYQLESLIQHCIAFLLDNWINSEHVISVKTFTRLHHDGLKEFTDGAVFEVVDKWIRRNFIDLCKTEDIHELSYEEMQDYIIKDDLNIPEEDLLEFLLKYAKTKEFNSEKTIKLLANVRQSLIEMSKLSLIVNENQALSFEIEQSKDIQNMKNPRYPRDIVICFGLKHSLKEIENSEIFNVRKNEWKIMENCGIANQDASLFLACLGNVIYYFGDFEPEANWRAVTGIDLKNGCSFEVEKLHYPDMADNGDRECLMTVAWNGGIVTFVGSNFGTFYDPKKDKWSTFPTFKTSRVFAILVVVEGNMFVIGGENEEDDEISSIEYYDSGSSEWTVCGSLKNIRGANVAAALDGKVYVFPVNLNVDEVAVDGECFQPVLENGRMSLIWHPSIKTPWTWRAFQVSVIDNKLLFTDDLDFNGNGGCVRKVRKGDMFSPATGEWSCTSDMCAWLRLNIPITVNTSDLEVDRIEELCSGKIIVPQT